jgi:hypothetical protein
MKLYKGLTKRLYKKLVRFHGGWVNEEILKVKVGDLVHDCDGFNHRVKSIEFFKFHIDSKTETCSNRACKDNDEKNIDKTGIKPRGKSRWYISDVEAIKAEDGNCFCGCHAFPEKPRTREDIETEILHWDSEEMKEMRDIAAKGENWEKFEQWLVVLKSGGHICDKDGILLEEFRPKKESIADENARM